MKKVYKVALSDEEEAQLLTLISKGEKDTAIARALQTSVSTVERTRKNLVLEGLKSALEEDPRPGAKPKLDAQGHGFLVALACSTPPLGREGWTLELLSDRLVALGYVESFSKEAVRRALKKTSSSRGCASDGPSRHRGRSSSGAWRR